MEYSITMPRLSKQKRARSFDLALLLIKIMVLYSGNQCRSDLGELKHGIGIDAEDKNADS